MHQYLKTHEHGSVLAGIADAMEATTVAAAAVGTAKAAEDRCVHSKSRVLPNPGMKLDLERAALVVIDPRIDFLRLKGAAAWPVRGNGVTDCNAVRNLARLFKASK